MATLIDGASARLVRLTAGAQARSTALLDAAMPPPQRAELAAHLSSWTSRHPHLSLFIGLHALTLGPPLLLFTLFSAATLLTALSIALLFALGASLALLTLVFALLVAPALLIGTATALALFAGATLLQLVLQRVQPPSSSSTAATPTPLAKLDAVTDPAPAPAAPPARPTAAPLQTDPPSATPSGERRHREELARQALGIPASVPLTTSTEAAVAAASARQQDRAAGEPHPVRMRLAEQIRLGEEIAQKALVGGLGVAV